MNLKNPVAAGELNRVGPNGAGKQYLLLVSSFAPLGRESENVALYAQPNIFPFHAGKLGYQNHIFFFLEDIHGGFALLFNNGAGGCRADVSEALHNGLTAGPHSHSEAIDRFRGARTFYLSGPTYLGLARLRQLRQKFQEVPQPLEQATQAKVNLKPAPLFRPLFPPSLSTISHCRHTFPSYPHRRGERPFALTHCHHTAVVGAKRRFARRRKPASPPEADAPLAQSQAGPPTSSPSPVMAVTPAS